MSCHPVGIVNRSLSTKSQFGSLRIARSTQRFVTCWGLAFLTGAIAIHSPAGAQAPPELVPYYRLPQSVVPTPGATDDDYTLGAGDQIRLDIFGIEQLSGTTYTLLVDGSTNLPWVGRVILQGLTVDQASKTLVQRYSRFIRTPSITVSLIAPRPIRIGIVGEVIRPGAYVTGQSAGGTISGDTSSTPIRTVTQALQAAGGITQLADVRSIEVRRSRLGNRQDILKVDLWQFLQSGDLSQDLTLRDGDTLIVPTVSAFNSSEATRLAAANFSPESIKVNVVGEVKAPGTISLKSNTTLNQVILAAGGFDRSRARTSDVQLIRINPDGTAVRRSIQIDLAAGVNEATNPALRNNDIVVVGRSGLAKSGDFLNTLLGPLNPLVGIFGILRLFGGGL